MHWLASTPGGQRSKPLGADPGCSVDSPAATPSPSTRRASWWVCSWWRHRGGALLLLLPWSTVPGSSTGVIDALFTSTSAVCVTGLAVVDTGTHWSHFGQVVILALIQLGGLGFMTIASLVAMVVSRRLGLRMTLIASRERGALTLGDVRGSCAARRS
jgi:Trk-type K+ transport system membrane component